jgi:hypothetical protein
MGTGLEDFAQCFEFPKGSLGRFLAVPPRGSDGQQKLDDFIVQEPIESALYILLPEALPVAEQAFRRFVAACFIVHGLAYDWTNGSQKISQPQEDSGKVSLPPVKRVYTSTSA